MIVSRASWITTRSRRREISRPWHIGLTSRDRRQTTREPEWTKNYRRLIQRNLVLRSTEARSATRLFVMHGVVIMTVDLTTMGVAVRVDQVQAEE